TRHVLFNTAWNIDAGIYTPNMTQGKVIVKGNVFSNFKGPDEINGGADRGGYMFNLRPPQAPLSAEDYNLVDSQRTVVWGSTYNTYSAFHAAQPTQGVHDKLLVDPQFVDAANGNLALQATSPARDAGALDEAYATFFNLYGIDIAK